jgi:uncharacterized protein
MHFDRPPRAAAWLHHEARNGFEVAFFGAAREGWRIEGRSSAVEEGNLWLVDYTITVDAGWVTREADVTVRTPSTRMSLRIRADGTGTWYLGGERAPQLDGCLDVDLEASVVTNTLPIHRLTLRPGSVASTPAAYVRALDLTVERLEQAYERLPDNGVNHRFAYRAPAFDFDALLTYDRSGLLVNYPGLAVRAG